MKPFNRIARAFAGATVLALAGTAPAWAYTQPIVHFSFGPAQSDSDASEFVTEKSTGPLPFGGLNFGWTKQGYGRADLAEGRMQLLYEERWGAPTGNVNTSQVGDATTVFLYDTLVATAPGSISITLRGHAFADASERVIPSLPLLRDDSWAGFGFGLYGEVHSPGTGALVGGGGQARATLDDSTNRVGPSVFAFDAGTAGQRKAVDASFTVDGRTGGTLTLTAWLNTGDRFNFTALAAARGWADHMQQAHARADLLSTAALSVSSSPGTGWVSESGVLLTAVPEPASALLLAAGLAGLAWRRVQSRR